MDIIEKTIREVDCDEIMLPVGWRNDAKEIKRFVTLDEINGEVEESITDPKLRDNAGKVITALLYGVVTSMEGMQKVNKDAIRALTTIDRDFLVVMMHKISYGDDIKWLDNCTHCNAPQEITIDVNNLKVRYLPAEYPEDFSFTLPKPIKDSEGNEYNNITIVLPNGWIQEKVSPIGRTNVALATTALLQAITIKLGNYEMPIQMDIFKKMSSKNRRAISRFIEELDLGVQLNVTETCAECGREFTTMVPIHALMGE